jgi:site-specific recombinase XerD
MTSLAPLLQSFFTERLIAQRRVSPHTVSSYRDTFRLLLCFAQTVTGKSPSRLDLADINAILVTAFLDHLERDRANSVRTRNNRLVAIHSLFRYAALREPALAAHIQRVLAIPQKRFEREVVSFLERDEIEAILASPDLTTLTGQRDHALLLLIVQTGLRVAEVTGLRIQDLQLGRDAHVVCLGKGRKRRSTPLTQQTAAVLQFWIEERNGAPEAPLFPGRDGGRLSTDAVQRLVAKHVRVAAHTCLSIAAKHVTPHVLRHSTAMQLLHAGVDSSVIALWLGHESLQSTQMYLHADMVIKQRALDRTAPVDTPTGRYRPPDKLLAFLEAL